jgi:hypothetical protein
VGPLPVVRADVDAEDVFELPVPDDQYLAEALAAPASGGQIWSGASRWHAYK